MAKTKAYPSWRNKEINSPESANRDSTTPDINNIDNVIIYKVGVNLVEITAMGEDASANA